MHRLNVVSLPNSVSRYFQTGPGTFARLEPGEKRLVPESSEEVTGLLLMFGKDS